MSRIHPTAVIESPVKLGKNVFVGAYVVIREGAEIGDNVVLGHHVVLETGVTIGEGCRVQAQCFFSPNTSLGSNVFVGPGTRFLNDRKILSHDRPGGGPDCFEPVEVLRGARIGASVTVAPGVVIGENALVGACSYVTCSVPMEQVWWGCPAKRRREVSPRELI